MHAIQEELPGARILDLFAGTGALGLEALSRGARSVDFVERGREALHALKANRARFRVTKKTRLFKKDVWVFLERVEAGAYEIAFADPPYTSGASLKLLEAWLARPYSNLLAVEHPRTLTLPGAGKRRVFEDSAVTIYRLGTKNREGKPSCRT
jgi:16S rRNA (guanine966-N2)-methyltransferase